MFTTGLGFIKASEAVDFLPFKIIKVRKLFNTLCLRFFDILNCLSYFRWSNDPPILSPHKPWSPDDIVSQVQPPPEEYKPLISTSSTIAIVIALLLFAFLVYYNMESNPQSPFS